MTTFVYYSTFIFNLAVCLISAIVIRRKIRKKTLSETTGKNLHSIAMLPLGAFSGTLLFWGLADLFEILGLDMTYGHGEILISAIVFNVFLSLLLLVAGRIFIGWEEMLSSIKNI
jgi:uncharacterized membrane protein